MPAAKPAGELFAWDRRPTESEEAFAAFAMYRSMGAERTVEAVATECTKSAHLLRRWSARHEWVSRAAAYDTEVARRAAVKLLESDADALARQALQHKAIQTRMAQRLLAEGVDLKELSLAQASREHARHARAEREARRIPKTVEVSGVDGGPLEVVYVNDWRVRRVPPPALPAPDGATAAATGEPTFEDDEGDVPNEREA